VGGEKVACWSTKAAISLKRVKIEEKLQWKAYRRDSNPGIPNPGIPVRSSIPNPGIGDALIPGFWDYEK